MLRCPVLILVQMPCNAVLCNNKDQVTDIDIIDERGCLVNHVIHPKQVALTVNSTKKDVSTTTPLVSASAPQTSVRGLWF